MPVSSCHLSNIQKQVDNSLKYLHISEETEESA